MDRGVRMVPFTPEHPVAPSPCRCRARPRSPLAAAIRTADRRRGSAWPRVGTLLRRFRCPVAARVRVDGGAGRRRTCRRRWPACGGGEKLRGPVEDLGRVVRVARPRGQAGMPGWDRDEWDVALDDQVIYRVMRDRASDRWFVEGYWD
jgi:hypothetical protein